LGPVEKVVVSAFDIMAESISASATNYSGGTAGGIL
jgi:hypothetical protein